MTIFRFSREITSKHPELYEYISQGPIMAWVTYILDWRQRKATELTGWTKRQVDNPSEELLSIAQNIPTGETTDQTMLNILAFVRRHLQYVPDDVQWNTPEYWATAEEIIETWRDDCEGGALLIYVLARLKGVPANRMLIMAGDVSGGGHAWLAYMPDEYPLNWAFLDWCYWYNSQSMNMRNLYWVNGVTIHGYIHNGQVVFGTDSKYIRLWFAFNEDKAHRWIKHRLGDER